MAITNPLAGALDKLNPIKKAIGGAIDTGKKFLTPEARGVPKPVTETLAQRNARLRNDFIAKMGKTNPSTKIAPPNSQLKPGEFQYSTHTTPQGEQKPGVGDWINDPSMVKKNSTTPPVTGTGSNLGAPTPNIKTPAPVVPTPTTPPVTTANIANSNLGYSSDNINAPAVQNTVGAYSQTQDQYATDLKTAEMAGAQQLQAAMAGNQTAEASDIASQQAILDTLGIKDKADYQTTVDMANATADEEKTIAGRGGNIAAAKMGKSGLLLSGSAEEQLKGDIAGLALDKVSAANTKRNSDIKTALTTLRASGVDIFTKTATLKALSKAMREKGVQPVLDAIKAGTAGKTGALGKVAGVVNGIQTGLIESQSGAAGALESNLSIENQYKNTPNDQRASLMTRLNKDLAPYGDLLNATIAAHPEWTKGQVETDLIQKIKGREDANAAYQIYLQSGKNDNAFWNAYGETISKPGTSAYTAMTPTPAQQAATAATLATQTSQATNPLTLTNAENLSWFKSLGQGSAKQQQFIKEFKAKTSGKSAQWLKEHRGEVFDELKGKFANQP